MSIVYLDLRAVKVPQKSQVSEFNVVVDSSEHRGARALFIQGCSRVPDVAEEAYPD